MDIRHAAYKYGLIDDPTVSLDQTEKLQAFLDGMQDGAFGAGKAILPPWRIAFRQIKVGPGLDLEGSGIGPQFDSGRGTFLKQLPGTNLDAIVNSSKFGPGQWMHWTRLANFRLEGNPTDASGSGIKYLTSPGEGCVLERIFVKNFPECGIWMADGATPMKMTNLHVFQNGHYGLRIGDSTGTKRVYASLIETISGDGNGLGLVHLQRLQRDYSVLCFMHVKSEGVTSGIQDNTIVIEDCTAGVEIHTMSMLGVLPCISVKSMIRIKGPASPRLAIHNYGGSGIDNTIVDEINNIVIPHVPKIALYYKDGLLNSLG